MTYWPQALVLAVVFIRIGVHTANHGKTRVPNRIDAISEVVSLSIFLGVLYAGGFFDVR